jgi:hypothetical protein
MNKIEPRFDLIVCWLSGEWLLNSGRRPNGGTVVIQRSLFVTFWVMSVSLLVFNVVNPCGDCILSIKALRHQLIAVAPWTAGVFGGVYLALYTRFAAQWSYLANVYNQIKQAEALGVEDFDALAQWKAGFIEDAINLHLAKKPIFASAIGTWAQIPAVKRAFWDFTADGPVRWSEDIESIIAMAPVRPNSIP